MHWLGRAKYFTVYSWPDFQESGPIGAFVSQRNFISEHDPTAGRQCQNCRYVHTKIISHERLARVVVNIKPLQNLDNLVWGTRVFENRCRFL